MDKIAEQKLSKIELSDEPGLKDGPNWTKFLVILLLLTLLAGALRFYKLGSPSYWTDEVYQIRDAVSGAGPGYMETRWVLQWLGYAVESWEPEGYGTWLSLGLTEWNGRLAAAIIGTVSVGVLGFLTALVIGRRAGLVFAALLAVLTWHIHWSQSARFYAPMFLYYNAALILYFLASHRSSSVLHGFAMICALLAVFVKPTSLMIFGVIGIDIVGYWWMQRRLPISMRSIIVIAIGAIACTAAVALLQWDSTSTYIEKRGGDGNSSALRVIGGTIYLIGPPLCFMVLMTIPLLWKNARRELIFFGAAAIVPIVSFVAMGTITNVELRYTLVCSYGWLVLAAMGISLIAGRSIPKLGQLASWAPLGIVIMALCVSNMIYFQSAYGNRPRWRDAYKYVEAHRKKGEEVIGLSTWAAKYYMQDDGIRNVKFDFDGLDTLKSNTWFVIYDYNYGFLKGNEHATLHAVFANRTAYPYDMISVYHYRVPSPDG